MTKAATRPHFLRRCSYQLPSLEHLKGASGVFTCCHGWFQSLGKAKLRATWGKRNARENAEQLVENGTMCLRHVFVQLTNQAVHE